MPLPESSSWWHSLAFGQVQPEPGLAGPWAVVSAAAAPETLPWATCTYISLFLRENVLSAK